MMDRILHAAPQPMMPLNAAIPPELERITLKCLEKRAEGRYQSARELLTDLWPLKRQLDATRATSASMRLERQRPSGRRPDVGAVERAVAGDASSAGTSCTPEATELVARGWAHLRSGSFFQLADAVSAFQAASAIDPTCAAAHAGFALVRVAQATVRDGPLVEALGEAKAPTHGLRWGR
jgi:hypothetical protein